MASNSESKLIYLLYVGVVAWGRWRGVEVYLKERDSARDKKWTQSIATCPVKSICFI